MDIVTFSTLFPSAAQPRHGLFVEARLRELRTRHDVRASVVAPVPWFPSQHPRFGKYATFASVPPSESRFGVNVVHPRYALPPKVGMHIAPRTLALGSSSALRDAMAASATVPLLDAHYFYPDGVAAAHLAERFELPLMITARGSDVNLLPENEAVRRRMLKAGERAQALVAVSSALAQRMRDIGLPDDKIHVLRNGVDLEAFAPRERSGVRAALNETLGLGLVDSAAPSPLILSVGNLLELKGHHLVIEALVQHPAAHLVIAGEGPERASLEARSVELGVAERVHFVGSVAQSELVRYYNAADLLVLASSREGMANVLLESLACGTPTVVTPVGGNPEVVAERAAGVVLHERSAQAVADGILQVLTTPPSRDDTRAYAEQFSWAEVTRQLFSLMQDVVRSFRRERDITPGDTRPDNDKKVGS